MEEAEGEQIKFKSNLNKITRGYPKNKSNDQSNQIKNVKNLYDSRQFIYINLFNDYANIRSKAIYKAKEDEKNRMKKNKMKQNRKKQDLKY